MRIEIVKQLTPLPMMTTAERNMIVPTFCRHTAGFTRQPIETKNTAANMPLSGAARSSRRLRATDEEPSTPIRNAPSAREKFSLYAIHDTRKQHPSSVRRRVSSSPSFATALSRRGTSTNPIATVHTKNTMREPSDSPTAPRERPRPFATPVTSAITPTHSTSSRIDVDITYFTNGRLDHFISSIVFASNVVAESHIAAPRNSDGTESQPKMRLPTV